MKKPKYRALISVSNKCNIEVLAQFLIEQGFEIISTGGTAETLRTHSIPVTPVEKITGKAEAFGGRVKTLDFNIEAGILYRRDQRSDSADAQRMGIQSIDLVVCNFYPFEDRAGQILGERATAGQFEQVLGTSFADVSANKSDSVDSRNPVLAELFENIDIGGPTMVRSAAKNYRFCAVLTNPEQYPWFMERFRSQTSIEGESVAGSDANSDIGTGAQEGGFFLDKESLLALAVQAIQLCARYDAYIYKTLNTISSTMSTPTQGETTVTAPPVSDNEAALDRLKYISLAGAEELRYGENPHQQAWLARWQNSQGSVQLANARVLQGKALSYNNWLDSDVAWKCVSELHNAFAGRTAVCIVKHGNPCGLALSGFAGTRANVSVKGTFSDQTSALGQTDTPKQAPPHQHEPETQDSPRLCLEAAWNCDPVSSFGSVIAVNKQMEADLARWLGGKFIEIVIAPSYTDEALQEFSEKKNLRLLQCECKPEGAGELRLTSIHGAVLIQNEDEITAPAFEVVTEAQFPEELIELARFGIIANKYAKSNAMSIVAKVAGYALLTGSGTGQANRLDSLKLLAGTRSKETLQRFAQFASAASTSSNPDRILVSDAFLPFRDNVDEAATQGIQYIVQPGGSIRDSEVIQACNEHGIAMCFTGARHFRH